MSDKNKILLVGSGLAAAAIAAAVLFFLLGREKPPEKPEGNEGEPPAAVDATVHEYKGTITAVSIEGTNVNILSSEGELSFSVSSAAVMGTDGNPLGAKDLVIGMEIQATVQRGIASSVRIVSVPDLAVLSPKLNNPIEKLEFNIEGIAYGAREEACLFLSNRRTGAVYEDGLSVRIGTDRKFLIPVNLSSALDAMPGDMLDAKLSLCGSGEAVSAAWGYFSGLTSKIKVYFLKDSCSNLYYVERVIPAAASPTRAAIEELLKGPNMKEAAEGIFTSANPSEKIRDIDFEEGTVYIDFYPSIVNVKRCSLSVLKTQIMRTLGHLPTGNLVITIEGEEENPLN